MDNVIKYQPGSSFIFNALTNNTGGVRHRLKETGLKLVEYAQEELIKSTSTTTKSNNEENKTDWCKGLFGVIGVIGGCVVIYSCVKCYGEKHRDSNREESMPLNTNYLPDREQINTYQQTSADRHNYR